MISGITEKLSYLKTLDIKGIWISPFFKSPMVDNGYDVSDYKQVDPVFGDINDFKERKKSSFLMNFAFSNQFEFLSIFRNLSRKLRNVISKSS